MTVCCRTSLAFVLLLGGCSAIFGLDPPEVVSGDVDAPTVAGDRDGDTIVDDVDNCPDTPNTNQADTDDDKIGDACQGCTMLPLRIEDDDDLDTVADTADNCIGIAGGAADLDADGIGSECDPSAGRDVRFCVLTFRDPAATEDPNVWSASWQLGGNFEVRNSALVHESSPLLDVATSSSAVFESAIGIAFDSTVRVTSHTAPTLLGLAIELLTTPVTLYTCQISVTLNGTAKFQLLKNNLVVDEYMVPNTVPASATVFGRATAKMSNGQLTVGCRATISGSGLLTSLSSVEATTLTTLRARPRLFADRATVYFDHLTAYKLGAN